MLLRGRAYRAPPFLFRVHKSAIVENLCAPRFVFWANMSDSNTEVQGPIDVYAVITIMVDQMAAIAWQKLGLQPDWGTGHIERDLAQAKVAIDITTHLSTFIEPSLDEADKQRIHSLIRDLRLNYVQKSQDS